jgi:hypothetical protein
MAIPVTNLHGTRVLGQIQQNLIQLQQDMRNNAATHKAMAQAQSPDLATLQSFITDCIVQYLKRLQWIIDLRNDAGRRAILVAMLGKIGWTEADIVNVVTALRAEVITLQNAPRTTYAQIITACDAMIAAVNPPDSLWPE